MSVRIIVERYLKKKADMVGEGEALYIPLVMESEFFDADFYSKKYNIPGSREDVAAHFCKVGLRKGYSPNKAFDAKWYLEEYPDVAEDGAYAFIHFIKFGRHEGRFQNREEKTEYERRILSNKFSAECSVKENSDVPQDSESVGAVLHSARCAREQYAGVGQNQANLPNNSGETGSGSGKVEYTDEEKVIIESGLFNRSFYLDSYPDVAGSGIDPVKHFCAYGWKEDRKPCEEFNTRYYKDKYPDVAQAGINPFLHWITYGRAEGRSINCIEIDGERSERTSFPSLIFVSHEASQTGAPAVLLTLMNWLKENTSINFRVVVGAQGPWNDRFEALAPTFYMDAYHHHELERELRQFCGNQVQAVYINTIASALYAEKLSFLQAEFVAHVHEMENVFQLFESHVEVLKRICTKYISVSPGSTQAIERRFDLDTIEVHYIKPFIDKRRLPKIENEKPTQKKVIFGCGAVERRKGFDLFCQVARALKEQGRQDFQMYWIGSDVGKDLEAGRVIAEHRVADVVHFMGPKEYPRDYFVWGDVFLLTSREDPYPLVCMEAAECGMPVVCFDERAGGMHTFVEEDAGEVVPYLDTAAMAEAVARLLDDDEHRHELGNRAHRKVEERHYVDLIAPQILSLLPSQIELGGKSELEAYKAMIEHAAAVSFDIFDTLVTRRVADPNVVFDVIEHRLSEEECAPLSFFEQRMQIAGKVLASKNGKVDDVSIDEIYQYMAVYCDADIEKQTEVAMCTAHPMGRELYDHAQSLNKPVYIVSDMYLDADTVKTILRTNGYHRWNDFFLSSEKGRKKDTGRLFELVKEAASEKGITAKDVLHIGDNWQGDVHHARKAGLSAVRFAPLYERPHQLVPLREGQVLSQSGRIWNSFTTQAVRLWRETHPEEAGEFYARLGFEVTGPLASMMAMHARKVADLHGARRVAFLARDGRIIFKAFKALYTDEIKAGAYEPLYLHLSRATVVPATFSDPLTSNDIYFLVEGLHLAEKPVSYFLDKAGLDADAPDVKAVVKRYFSSADNVPDWQDLAALSRMFTDLSSFINTANRPRREALAAYLRANGLTGDSPENIVIVDVGWLLNIQSRLVKFLRELGSATKLIGAYVGSRDRVHKRLAHHSLLFDNGDPADWSAFLERHVTLFEVLFSAPEPSAKQLLLDEDGNVSLQLKELGMPLPSEFQVAQKLHFGAERYFEYLAEARHVFFPEQVSKDYFFRLFHDLVHTENDIAKATLGNFEVRLGGQHEFLTRQALIPKDRPFEYIVKNRDEYFEPISFPVEGKDVAEVVIVTSAGLQNGSTRYRAIHLGDALRYQGVSSVLIHAATPVERAKQLIESAQTVVFQRCFEGQGQVKHYLKVARQNGKRCLAEMDDLVFPEHILSVGSVKGGEWDEKHAMLVARSYEKMLKQVDGCIVSTPALKEYIEERYGLECCVVRNKVTPCRLRPPRQRVEGQPLRLIYASGTYSHKQDFSLIEEPLYRFLVDNPRVSLSILGAAQVTERLLALPNVGNYPLLPYGAMLNFIAEHDLMLVPLEDDVFNRAKSSVKFVEGGAVGVPVMASRVGEFAKAIEHERNGLLVHEEEGWLEALTFLEQSTGGITVLQKGAYCTVKNQYITSLLEENALAFILYKKA